MLTSRHEHRQAMTVMIVVACDHNNVHWYTKQREMLDYLIEQDVDGHFDLLCSTDVASST